MQKLIDQYNVELQQEKFAALVATRVASILDGTAEALNFKPSGGAMYTHEEQTLMFADVIARSVVHHMASKSE
jgi:hypothetical protein